MANHNTWTFLVANSATRLGDLLQFGHLFKDGVYIFSFFEGVFHFRVKIALVTLCNFFIDIVRLLLKPSGHPGGQHVYPRLGRLTPLKQLSD